MPNLQPVPGRPATAAPCPVPSGPGTFPRTAAPAQAGRDG